MRTHALVSVAVLTGLLALSGCASKVTQPEKYSGFLKDYSGLQETTSATGKPVMRWVAPGFDPAKYDSIVYLPVTYYPAAKPTRQINQQALDGVLDYTNSKLKAAAAARKPLVTSPRQHSLIFRGAITGVDASKQGLQFYEVIPVAMVVAGTQMATGHRTLNTHLYFEGELIDAQTGSPVLKVVRKGEGRNLSNDNAPVTVDTLKQVVDDMATDATMFDINK